MCPDPEPAAGASDVAATQPAASADQDASEFTTATGCCSDAVSGQRTVQHCFADVCANNKDQTTDYQPTGKII